MGEIVINKIKNKEKGIILILLSVFFGSVTLTIIKLGGNLPVYEKSFLRNVATLIVTIFIIKKSKGVFFGHKGSRWLLFLRATCGTLAVWTSYYSIAHMMLANATILSRLSPLFSIIFAFIFLKESIRPVHIIAFIVAFVGVVFVVKPGGGHTYVLIPSIMAIVSSVLAAGVITCVRSLGKKENPNTIVFFYAMFSMCASIPLMIYHFQMPTLRQGIILLIAGISSTACQFTLTFAYKYAAAKEISVYSYTNIIFVTIFGYLIWGNIPDSLSIVGYILIIGSALIVFWINRMEGAKV